MGNVTHILPVLQWLEVVIAFVPSFKLLIQKYKKSETMGLLH